MASLSNSTKDTSANFTTGRWEDVKDYTSAVITLKSAVDGSGTVEWANTLRGAYPSNDDIIATESFLYDGSSSLTKQWDHRGRWFRLKYDHSGPTTDGSFTDVSLNIQTLYKKAPTELKIVDDSANVVSVNQGTYNSLYTILTDGSGDFIRTTNEAQLTGDALFVHLADSSGNSLATTSGVGAKSLYVALRDGSNNVIDSTGLSGNSLYVRPGDISGNAQASTFNVSGSYTRGVALFAALADNCGVQIDTTNKVGGDTESGHNALFVHLTDASGRSISSTNALSVINTASSVGASAFDFSTGITNYFTTNTLLDDAKITLYNIFAYNDDNVTTWLKVYDISSGSIVNDSSGSDANFMSSFTTPKLNITLPAGRTRDLNFPAGATFNNGVYFRATTRYDVSSVLSPTANAIWVNGSYVVETA